MLQWPAFISVHLLLKNMKRFGLKETWTSDKLMSNTHNIGFESIFQA